MRLPASICETPKAITSRRSAGALAGGEDQARVGHRQPQDRDQPLEVVVAHAGSVSSRSHAAGRPQPREADRVRADAVVLLQVQGVADQAQHLEPPVVQAEQGADAHVVAARPPSPGSAPSSRQR